MALRSAQTPFNSSVSRLKVFYLGMFVFGVGFAVLLTIRAGWLKPGQHRSILPVAHPASERNAWMNVIQNDRKIGFSHTVFTKSDNGFQLAEHLFLRLNAMGLVQDIQVKTRADLKPDFSLSTLDFNLFSGRFSFSARGTVQDNVLYLTTQTQSSPRSVEIPLDGPVFIPSAILEAVRSTALTEGQSMAFSVFDPATLTKQTVEAEIAGTETLTGDNKHQRATKVALTFKGVTQWAWINDEGEVLQQTGPLGMRLEKTTKEVAQSETVSTAFEDLTQLFSVTVATPISSPETLVSAVFEIHGIPEFIQTQLPGGRQGWKAPELTVTKESLEIPDDLDESWERYREFLAPTPFMQSDHPEIVTLARNITDKQTTVLKKAEKLVNWVHRSIEKRPVISVPDALSTLANRTGDCNEHAMLLAALARASNIPAQVESGLAYLNGRFFYHAWNRLFVGKWITADAVFGQFPADVTHLRLATGMNQMTNLTAVIGKISINTISTVPGDP